MAARGGLNGVDRGVRRDGDSGEGRYGLRRALEGPRGCTGGRWPGWSRPYQERLGSAEIFLKSLKSFLKAETARHGLSGASCVGVRPVWVFGGFLSLGRLRGVER